MFHVVEAMTRWIAPILSFTADEVWENMSGKREDLGVFTAEWYDGLFAYESRTIKPEVWDLLELVRVEVTKSLEVLRQEGGIGSGLDAEVTIYADQATINELQEISGELRFVLITSDALLAPLSDLKVAEPVKLDAGHEIVVQAIASKHAKCVRCWHHRPDVGSHADHPELCGRCIDNVDGDGEPRFHA
jgi:isoleucyl-tRNA synthetase